MSNKKSDFMANLMRAKQTMDAVEGGNYKVDHTQVAAKMNSGNGQLLESLPDGAVPQRNVTRPVGSPSVDRIQSSKLPDSVKKIMAEQPIPQMEMASGGGPTFSLDDVRGMVSSSPAQQAAPQPTSANYTQAPQQINETVVTNSKGQMLITLTEAELDKKINDALVNFMTETFVKQLRETTIKKTISTLIKEGKVRVKTKTTK